MLKRLRVNNFRSLVNVEFRPAGVNVLIGPNNSGKTNLCKAMQFLGLTACGSVKDAVRKSLRESWNITNVYSGSNLIEFDLDCSLFCEGEQLDFEYSLQIAAKKADPLGMQSLRITEESLQTGQDSLFREESDPAFPPLHEGTWLSEIDDREHPQEALFKRYLRSWAYHSLSPAALRSTDVAQDEPGLLSNGSNLCATMFRLHNGKPRLEKQIIEIVKALEPKLDLLTYSFPDPESVYMFIEDQEGNRFGVQSISDGTLRFMAMTYLILAAGERDESQPSPVIVIEEPENGLYVRHLKPLIELIEPDGKAGQFIFTTHSPYFIDLFDSTPEGVHVMKPGVPSSSLTKPDPEKIRKTLDQMPLGEMHFREMLG
jgi:predicted ATPase